MRILTLTRMLWEVMLGEVISRCRRSTAAVARA